MPAVTESKYLVQCGWDDVPHITEKAKRDLLASCEPHLRDARSKGTPSLGAGAIYPIAVEDIRVDPFRVPDHWPRGYGMDVGWNRTAVIWGALDREADVLYFTTEHYRGKAEPSVHATAIKARGEWIKGKIDPAANGRAQKDGEQLMATYRALGLHISNAENGVEAGINDMLERLSTGRLKVFSTCVNWFAEYKLYRRDENGKIVKKFDHLMDASRYAARPSAVSSMQVRTIAQHSLGRTQFGETVAGY